MLNVGVFYKKEKVGNEKLQGYALKTKSLKEPLIVVKNISCDLRKEMIEKLIDIIGDSDEVLMFSNIFKDKESIDKVLQLKSLQKHVDFFENKTLYFKEFEYDEFETKFTENKAELMDLQERTQEANNFKELVVMEKLERNEEPLTSVVELDEFTASVNKNFDFDFGGTNTFYPYKKPNNVPTDFSIGIIVGASGTGKTTLMHEFGEEEVIEWDKNKAIISHFNSVEEGTDKLTAVGLNSIPSWTKPYHVLSNGEKFRADLARRLKDGAVIDEFTSVVDRNVAKATSTSISKYIKKKGLKNVVFVTCHSDIVDWLLPDWIVDTNDGTMYDGSCLRGRPKLELSIYETKDYHIWEMFKDHHYLSADLNKASRRFVGVLNGDIVAFNAVLALPSGSLKNSWRGHRTVVLPDYQGLGLGVRFSDAIGQIHIDEGKRYFSRTCHIRMGEYRENSKLWKPTAMNKKKRTGNSEHKDGSWKADMERIAFAHEYIGEQKENNEIN